MVVTGHMVYYDAKTDRMHDVGEPDGALRRVFPQARAPVENSREIWRTEGRAHLFWQAPRLLVEQRAVRYQGRISPEHTGWPTTRFGIVFMA